MRQNYCGNDMINSQNEAGMRDYVYDICIEIYLQMRHSTS